MLMKNMKSNADDIEVFSNCVDSIEEAGVKDENVVTFHAISLQAFWGTENYQTMRMQGKVKKSAAHCVS